MLNYEIVSTRASSSREGVTVRIWKTPTGFFVKTHTYEADVPLGVVAWIIQGSLCDANGAAIQDARGRTLVHEEKRVYSVQSEAEGSIDEAAARMKDDFDAEHRLVVAMLERFARDLAVARAALT